MGAGMPTTAQSGTPEPLVTTPGGGGSTGLWPGSSMPTAGFASSTRLPPSTVSKDRKRGRSGCSPRSSTASVRSGLFSVNRDPTRSGGRPSPPRSASWLHRIGTSSGNGASWSGSSKRVSPPEMQVVMTRCSALLKLAWWWMNGPGMSRALYTSGPGT